MGRESIWFFSRPTFFGQAAAVWAHLCITSYNIFRWKIRPSQHVVKYRISRLKIGRFWNWDITPSGSIKVSLFLSFSVLFFSFLFFFVILFLTETTHALQEPNLDKQVSSSLQEIILLKNPFSWDLYSAENLFHVLLKSNQTIQEVMLSFFVFLCIFYSFFQSLKNDPQVSLILSTASSHFGI